MLASAFLCGAARAADFDPEIQRAFLEAMRLMEARDYPAAIATLRALAKKSDTLRIKLELAQALACATTSTCSCGRSTRARVISSSRCR